jgi:hypothetical protein
MLELLQLMRVSQKVEGIFKTKSTFILNVQKRN